MPDKTTTSRRDALGIASIAAFFVLGGEAEARPAKAGKAARPGTEELAHAMRLYGGELGGRKGAR